jgi:hypothetical protein
VSFTFPDDARWNAEWQAVEFGVEIGEYRGVVRVPRISAPITKRQRRPRQLMENGNVEISGRDLR